MSLIKNSALFAVGTILSRITGLLRESVMAGVFGAGVLMDAFVTANRIPNLLRELLAEGALGNSATKMYASLRENNPDRARLYFYQSVFFFLILSLLISILGMIYAPEVVGLMTMKRQAGADDLLTRESIAMTRVLSPFLAFMTVGAVATSVLHDHGRFFLSGMAPVALNCGYIAGALVLAQMFGSWISDGEMMGLCLGVLLGGFSHMLILLWGAVKKEPFSRSLFTKKFFVPSRDIVETLRLMGPMMIAGGAAQFNIFLNSNYATALEEGSVAWLNYAFRVLQLPIGLFAVGVSSVALPTLSRAISQKASSEKIAEHLFDSLNLVFWLITPCFCFLIVDAEAVVALLYGHGHFGVRDTFMTAQALTAYSYSLFGYGSLKVLQSYYYATSRTNVAMWLSFGGIVLHIVALEFFTKRFGHVGLAMSSACTLSLNALALAVGVSRDRLVWPWKKTARSFTRLVLSAVGAILLYKVFLILGSSWLNNLELTKSQAFMRVTLSGGAVFLVFAPFFQSLVKRRIKR